MAAGMVGNRPLLQRFQNNLRNVRISSATAALPFWLALRRRQVCEKEPIAKDDLSNPNVDRSLKHRPSRGERVEFAILSAWIHICRKFVQQGLVKPAADEAIFELAWVDTGEPRL